MSWFFEENLAEFAPYKDEAGACGVPDRGHQRHGDHGCGVAPGIETL